MAQISEELGILVMTLYKCRQAWRLHGELMPSSEREQEGWSAANKFTVVLESSVLNATELNAWVLKQGWKLHPRRCTRSTRCFRQPEVVWMNPPSNAEDIETATLVGVA